MARLGPSALSDIELLALVLRNGRRDESVLGLASLLLAEGGLRSLSVARLEELTKVSGLGPAKAAALIAAFELGRRMATLRDERVLVDSPGKLAHLVQGLVPDSKRESVFVVVLDGGHRHIATVPMTSGAADRCLLPVREMLSAVLRYDGVSFAVVHNHPSGDLRPSRDDLAGTRAIRAGADAAGLVLLDHVIITTDGYGSLREMGYFSAESAAGSLPRSKAI